MGSSIPRSCLVPGCSGLAQRRGRCLLHASLLERDEQEYDAARYRDPADPMRPNYFLARWKTLRSVVLNREPLCRTCAAEGRAEPATVVDHIKRARSLPEMSMFWDEANLQPLCKRCHDRKTAREVGFVKC